jgi:hypothetical protein
MLEVFVLLDHGSFVDVIIRRNAVVVGILGELSNIYRVVPAEISALASTGSQIGLPRSSPKYANSKSPERK